MGKTLRDGAILVNILFGLGLFAWGFQEGMDDVLSLARVGIGLGVLGLANIATAIHRLVDEAES